MFLTSRGVHRRSLQAACAKVTEWISQGTVVDPDLGILLCPEPDILSLGSCVGIMAGGKTPKRQAAEAFLQSRFMPPLSNGASAERPSKRRNISTSAHVSACSISSQAAQPCSVGAWCGVDVSLPAVDWGAIASSRLQEIHNTASPHLKLPKYQLAQGIDIYRVEAAGQMPEALQLLRDSMKDSVVSIDLEWKPDFVRDTSKVALMQLSSATCCVLIRTCKLGKTMPQPLLDFLRSALHLKNTALFEPKKYVMKLSTNMSLNYVIELSTTRSSWLQMHPIALQVSLFIALTSS